MMLKYELKKVLNKRMNRVLLAAAMLSFRAVDANGESRTGLSAARIIVADKNRWQGELTPEVIAKSVESRQAGDWQSTSDIIYSTSRMLVGEFSDLDDYEAILSADSAQIASIYDTYHDNLRVMSEEYGDTPEKQAFLMEQYDKIDTPFTYEAYDSWDTMLMYATTCGLILIIVISFITAGVFAEEFQYKADAVFFSTRYGRSKAVHAKIRAGLIIATVVYGIGIGLLSIISFSVMGISGASTAYQFCYFWPDVWHSRFEWIYCQLARRLRVHADCLKNKDDEHRHRCPGHSVLCLPVCRAGFALPYLFQLNAGSADEHRKLRPYPIHLSSWNHRFPANPLHYCLLRRDFCCFSSSGVPKLPQAAFEIGEQNEIPKETAIAVAPAALDTRYRVLFDQGSCAGIPS